ncbi:MAG: MoxR family ATPase [Acidobacteria bacterium]|nr:MAG: MoxR family ATPase [Acidobacteriota bacterium]REK03854.1 MAG: MoxR family ATPase [Acidobacteriota bacterium]
MSEGVEAAAARSVEESGEAGSPELWDAAGRAASAFAALRSVLDRHVVAHDEVKQALLLALATREHIYIEGPPGTAKTRISELTAQASDLEFFFYQLHRDTRLAELVGDVVLERRTVDQGEQIHQRIEPGGLLTAEICVLDDVSRAPGEALNVLLRILNERRFGAQPIPLMTAIATGNPMDDEYYNEPLDPANLDRFALQLRVHGLVQTAADAAAELIDRFASGEVVERPEPVPVIGRAELDAAYSLLPSVAVPRPVRVALLEFLRSLVVEHGCDETNSLLTDRSFLVKAVKLARARALLDGRVEVGLEDLDLLRWMTTFRVPQEVAEIVPNLILRASGR